MMVTKSTSWRITDGHLPYPYGREMTGYEVTNLTDTLMKGKASGVDVLVPPYKTDERESAVVQFSGGYIAETHSVIKEIRSANGF
jgi:hypothetical protein